MAAHDSLGRQFDAVRGTESRQFTGLAQPHAVEGVSPAKHLAPWHKTEGYALPGKAFLSHLKNEVDGMPWIANN